MKRVILVFVFACLLVSNTEAQMSLDHSFSFSYHLGFQNAQVVNLNVSGKKILVMTNQTTLSFYNLDYSLWKTITLPSMPPYGNPGVGGTNLNLSPAGTVMYPSENLFNTDALLEVAVFYGQTNVPSSAIYIINETGTAIDSIKNVMWAGTLLAPLTVYNTAASTFKAIVGTSTGAAVYSLPGTIPCDVCGNGLGLAKNQKINEVSEPIPNPSKGEVKITFALPEGTKQGEISLYDINGKLINTYKVDNTFGFITLNNSDLASGLYYYNLIADGNVTVTKKMVVLK